MKIKQINKKKRVIVNSVTEHIIKTNINKSNLKPRNRQSILARGSRRRNNDLVIPGTDVVGNRKNGDIKASFEIPDVIPPRKRPRR